MNNTLSIVHLVYTMGLGGIEMSASKLALDQRERGCDITVVCLYQSGCIGEDLRNKGIEVVALNLRRGFGMMNLIIPLLRICVRRKVDVLCVHTVGVEIPVAIVAAISRIRKRVLAIRAFANYSGWRYWWARLGAKVASVCYSEIICISNALKQHEVHHLHRNPEQISVIWNGVDTAKFCPRFIEQSSRAQALGLNSIEPNTFVVGMGAQLREFKDIPTLMRAASLVKNYGRDDVLFVVAGKGPLEAKLKALAIELGIEDSFKFVGPITDMPRFLNAIDMLALTSPFEGLGVIVLEAMATGKAVVTTDSGGVRDCVIDGENGIIVPVKDDKSLAQAIIKLMDDETLRNRMGQVGLERARRYFTLEQYTQAYWDLISN